MSQKRWVCPDCGKGALAPSKMTEVDVRRYCLPCSKRTGKLVRRTCPALTVERERAKQQRLAREQRKRATRRRQNLAKREAQIARETVCGVVVRALVRKWLTLAAWPTRHASRRGESGGMNVFQLRQGAPEIVIRRSKKNDERWTGHAFDGYRITMTFPLAWKEATPRRLAAVFELVLHEMCHLAVGLKVGHGDDFNKALCAAAESLWQVEVSYRYGNGGYGPSRRIHDVLTAKLEALGVEQGLAKYAGIAAARVGPPPRQSWE